MCTYPVQPVCTFILHIPGYINIYKSTVDCIAHFSSLHILTPYFILLFLLIIFFFILLLPIFKYMLLCYVSSFIFIFLHCPLSGPVLTSISLLIIPCMIVYVTNKREPWTLNLERISIKAKRKLVFLCCKQNLVLARLAFSYRSLHYTYILRHLLEHHSLENTQARDYGL